LIFHSQYRHFFWLVVAAFSLVINLVTVNNLQAQDPQFSQYYAAPLYLNPGFAGINQKGRAGLNYRNQWPSLAANYETYSFYTDYFFEPKHSALGMIVNTDKVGTSGYTSTNLGLLYAYQLRLTQDWTFRPGVEVDYYWRDINFSSLTFPDQFNNSGLVNPTTQEPLSGLHARFFDMSFGGVLHNDKMWLGASLHHVLEPNQSVAGGNSPLPRKFSLHGGYKIHFSEISPRAQRSQKGRERSLTPTFNYKQQGAYKQLDIGAYVTLQPIFFGVWYRGLPVNGFKGATNNEAIVSMVGFNAKSLTVGYSFDYTISNLTIGSGGAHEVSLIYTFSFDDPRKPSREVRELRCPVPFIF